MNWDAIGCQYLELAGSACAPEGMDILLLGVQGTGLPAGSSPLIPPVEKLFTAPGRVMTLGMLKCVMGRRGVQGVEAQTEWSQVAMWQYLSMAPLTGPQLALGWLAAEGQDGCLKRTSLHMHDISRNTGG